MDSECRPLEDPLVQQLTAIVVGQLCDKGELNVLADRLADLGEDVEAEWVRSFDVNKVVARATDYCPTDPEIAREVAASIGTAWDQLCATFPTKELAVLLGMPEVTNDLERARLERSVVYDLVRRVYCSAVQEAMLEPKYHREDEGPYPPEEGEAYWREGLGHE